MHDTWFIQLYPGSEFEYRHDGTCVVQGASGLLRWKAVSVARAAALKSLQEGASVSTLTDSVVNSDGPIEGAKLRLMIEHINNSGSLVVQLRGEQGPLLTAIPMTAAPVVARTPRQPLRLSRFAAFVRESNELQLTSPRSQIRVLIHEPKLAAWLLGSNRLSIEDHPPSWQRVLELLYGADALVAENNDTENSGALACWERHDLDFHVRSRMGRHDHPVGATFRFRPQAPPWPAVKQAKEGSIVLPLPPVDLADVKRSDPDLTTAIESRRSTRAQGAEPISVDALAELLYRAHRVRRREDATSDRPYPVAWRPYPGAGACYELELYPVVRSCDGLDPGVYRYLADRHALELVAPLDSRAEQLLSDARSATPAEELPQILLVMTSRFPRLAWKYETMAYRASLQDTGVLIQTVYLIATAMRLAVSAIGSGDVQLFGTVANLDPYEEGSVAEMIIGSLPAPPTCPTST